jgi:hypothetical protein
MMEGRKEYRAYLKAYNKMLVAILNLRFFWTAKPEDFLMFVMLTEQAANSGEVVELTEAEKAIGRVPVNIDGIAAAFEECLHLKYAPYADFQDLKKNGRPLPIVFSKTEIERAQTMVDTFIVEEVIKHTVDITLNPDNNLPHKITRLWAEAFVKKLSRKMKLPNPGLCEVYLANNIYKGTLMGLADDGITLKMG